MKISYDDRWIKMHELPNTDIVFDKLLQTLGLDN